MFGEFIRQSLLSAGGRPVYWIFQRVSLYSKLSRFQLELQTSSEAKSRKSLQSWKLFFVSSLLWLRSVWIRWFQHLCGYLLSRCVLINVVDLNCSIQLEKRVKSECSVVVVNAMASACLWHANTSSCSQWSLPPWCNLSYTVVQPSQIEISEFEYLCNSSLSLCKNWLPYCDDRMATEDGKLVEFSKLFNLLGVFLLQI